REFQTTHSQIGKGLRFEDGVVFSTMCLLISFSVILLNAKTPGREGARNGTSLLPHIKILMKCDSLPHVKILTK
ncbi:MAG TPA: hypothetical protein VLM38_06265, partial [Blastocatellia bacterium]|nr:hypothetical protein [Blastocatellia bacterium]